MAPMNKANASFSKPSPPISPSMIQKNSKKAIPDTTIPAIPKALNSGLRVTTMEIVAVMPKIISDRLTEKSFALAGPIPVAIIDNAPSSPAMITITIDALMSC